MGILRPVRNNESADEDNYRDRILCLGSCMLRGGGSALLCGGVCNEKRKEQLVECSFLLFELF